MFSNHYVTWRKNRVTIWDADWKHSVHWPHPDSTEEESNTVHEIIQLKDGRLMSFTDDAIIRVRDHIGTTLEWKGHVRQQPVYNWGKLLQLKNGCILSNSLDGMILQWNLQGSFKIIVKHHHIICWLQLHDERLAFVTHDHANSIRICNIHDMATDVHWLNELNEHGGIDRCYTLDDDLISTQLLHEEVINKFIQLHDGRIMSCTNNAINVWALGGTCLQTFRSHDYDDSNLFQCVDGLIVMILESSPINAIFTKIYRFTGEKFEMLELLMKNIQSVTQIYDGTMIFIEYGKIHLHQLGQETQQLTNLLTRTMGVDAMRVIYTEEDLLEGRHRLYDFLNGYIDKDVMTIVYEYCKPL